jgi:hypothetical protein
VYLGHLVLLVGSRIETTARAPHVVRQATWLNAGSAKFYLIRLEPVADLLLEGLAAA